jgi:regulator of sigma E protease
VDFIQSAFSSAWTVFLIALFFGGSIFVHELGHFLAARRRGMVVEVFSIGFGPPIWSRRGKDGVEYRLSWIPLGGYVRLPQLAAIGAIEGENTSDIAVLPTPSYGTLMLVSVAGVTCNIIFAFLLACVLWVVGQPTTSDLATTRIGYVQPKIDLPDGEFVTSPASEAGLRVGDIVRAIDGRAVNDWQDLVQTLMISSGHSENGSRETVFTIERDGRLSELAVQPRLAGEEHNRRVGISPAYEPIVQTVPPGSVAARTGLQAQDRLLALEGTPILSLQTLVDLREQNPARALALSVRRGSATLNLTIPPQADAKEPADLGAEYVTESLLMHPTPFRLLGSFVSMTFRTFGSLLNPHSDIGLSKLSGPVGIAHVFYQASQVDIRLVLWFAILINVNLAIFNLLPIPVLDGGHMVFATIGKLRGRAVPQSFIATAQSVFMVLLLSMVLYVSFFDVRRLRPSTSKDKPAATAPAVEPVK